MSLMNIRESLPFKNYEGFSTGESLYLLKPKSFLVIGTLNEFKNEKGQIHEAKYSSFELFRRSINDIEIINFDELYEWALAVIGK